METNAGSQLIVYLGIEGVPFSGSLENCPYVLKIRSPSAVIFI